MSFFDQHDYTIRCEWGAQGIAALQPISDVIIIVDILSFSTCVDIGVGNGALIYPYRWRDETAEQFAASLSAFLAQPHRTSSAGFSLSPASLRSIPAGTRLVLPSPNGATLTHLTGTTTTLAGCLRNARPVAEAAQQLGHRISVIAAGERWPNGSIRPAIEDWVGAGAIIAHLAGTRSPEAELASQAFSQARSNLAHYLRSCSSGRELIGRGFAEDVEIATELNVSDTAPIFVDGAYRRYSSL